MSLKKEHIQKKGAKNTNQKSIPIVQDVFEGRKVQDAFEGKKASFSKIQDPTKLNVVLTLDCDVFERVTINIPFGAEKFKFCSALDDVQLYLTPKSLTSSILPAITALCEIEKIINPENPVQPRIVAITQSSPISVSAVGLPEAYRVLREDIIPWRRKHGQELSLLIEDEKKAEIEKKRAEVAEAIARTEKDVAEAAKIRAEAVRIETENRQKQFQITKEQIEFVVSLVEKLKPESSEVDRFILFKDLLPHIEALTSAKALHVRIEPI